MSHASATRACYLPRAQLRPFDELEAVLDRCVALGFDTVVLPSLFADGEDADQARLGDPTRLPAVLQWRGTANEGLSALAELAGARGLRLAMDVRLDEVAANAPVSATLPHCFRPLRATDGPLPDPRVTSPQADAWIARFDGGSTELLAWWADQLSQWCAAGITAFRCLWPQKVPPSHWESVIAQVRHSWPDAEFWAWTPGTTPSQMDALIGRGFDVAFASLGWWDFRSDWYLEEDARLRRFPRVIAACSDPLRPDSSSATSADDADADARRRDRLARFAALTGDGLLASLGGASEDADARLTEANAAIAGRGPVRRTPLRPLLPPGDGRAGAWLYESLPPPGGAPEPSSGRAATLIVANADLCHVASVPADVLLRGAAGASHFVDDAPGGRVLRSDETLALEPAEVRRFGAVSASPTAAPARARPTAERAATAPRIAIENVAPSVDAGAFPVKRIVGERVTVQADIFSDGHDLIAARVAWRPLGERQWRSAPMRHLGNDRWCGEFPLERLGLHEFTVEAWRDRFATARMDLEKKRAADKLTALDVDETCALVVEAASASGDAALQDIAGRLQSLDDLPARCELLVAPETACAMAGGDIRPFLSRCATVFRVDAERHAATYGSWYELFPRSQAEADVEGHQRHGTFDDVIARLPAIRDMGFDVLYMPPIHPIGRSNRKGRNNSVTAEPGEPGSPYAIGAAEGGHDAIHPELGTLEDFRRLRAAAASHGLELALDFAIQCSPDHPWLREHPDWFAWRADGSIRYAENPPKKYEDIVNVDFYAEGAVPALWLALRDVVAFWVNEGVRLFRVDNPHTKPFPFWEWMIGDIRARHPDVVFLSEAFTRPRLMYRLAKIGFSQSYTYFTWRNGKAELAEYLTELADTPVREFFRPHFFVNTPDINPAYLQTSGRAGHLVRAALATTLSGLWGMYSGFELCEATPLTPGKEEYLDSEKYQLRQWDWQRAGNIVQEITRLNLLRRLNPALQTHLGVRFYNAFNDRILYFGKRRSAREDMVLVAVNLDPHAAQEAGFEVPLWEWGLPDHASVRVEDLWRGTRGQWHGKIQHVRLDPGELPFAIWRIGPVEEEVA
jgi:starch synthase (maltosyl-transferring)